MEYPHTYKVPDGYQKKDRQTEIRADGGAEKGTTKTSPRNRRFTYSICYDVDNSRISKNYPTTMIYDSSDLDDRDSEMIYGL